MICGKCNTEMMIDHTEFEVVGDQSPDTDTKLYNVPIFKCRNPACVEHGKEKRGESIPLEIKNI